MAYFRSPKILFGSGILRKIGSELEGMGKKAVLIAGKRSAKLSDQLVEVLAKAGFEVNVWDVGLAILEPRWCNSRKDQRMIRWIACHNSCSGPQTGGRGR